MLMPVKPKKFVIVTGIDVPPPSALPFVCRVVTPPLSLAVRTSDGLIWPNCKTVTPPAFACPPRSRVATHAIAKGQPKRRANPRCVVGVYTFA